MEIVKKEPAAKGPAERFTGDVWLDAIARVRARGDKIGDEEYGGGR